MNQKGFTLVEVLATIVIISVLGLIAYTSVTSYIKNSKQKAEDKFFADIENQIDSYIALNSAQFRIVGSDYEFTKKVISSSGTSVTNSWTQPINAKAYLTKIEDNGDNIFTLKDLIDDLKVTDKFQNPNTNGICNDDIEIEVYKDSDYVYYYYVNMKAKGIGCTASKNINTIPDNLMTEICKNDYDKYEECEGVTNE